MHDACLHSFQSFMNIFGSTGSFKSRLVLYNQVSDKAICTNGVNDSVPCRNTGRSHTLICTVWIVTAEVLILRFERTLPTDWAERAVWGGDDARLLAREDSALTMDPESMLRNLLGMFSRAPMGLAVPGRCRCVVWGNLRPRARTSSAMPRSGCCAASAANSCTVNMLRCRLLSTLRMGVQVLHNPILCASRSDHAAAVLIIHDRIRWVYG